MAFTDDDLKYSLTPETDVGAIEKYLANVEGLAQKTGNKVGKTISEGLSAVGDSTKAKERWKLEEALTDSMREQVALNSKLNAPFVLDLRVEALKQITQELEKQRDELEKQKLLLDPEVMQKRLDIERESTELAHRKMLAELEARLDPHVVQEEVRREKELAEIQQKIADAKAKERGEKSGKQGFDIKEILTSFKEGGLVTGLKTMMSQAFSGINWSQLLAGGLGAFNAQGVTGAAGSIAGGMIGAKTERDKKRDDPAANLSSIRDSVSRVPTDAFVKPTRRPDSRNRLLPDLSTVRDSINRSPVVAPGKVTTAVAGRSAMTGIGEQAAGSIAGGAITGGISAGAGAAAGMGLEALAGPVGIALMAAQAAAKVGGQLGSIPFKAISGGLAQVDKALRGMQGPLGPLGSALDATSDLLGAVEEKLSEMPLIGDMLGPIVSQLAAVPATLKGILETLTSFAAKASPAQFRMLEMAIEDTQAVIGLTFLPAMDLMREGIKLVGDVLANLLPNSDEAAEALSEVTAMMAEAGDQIRAVLAEIGPEVRGQVLQAMRQMSRLAAELLKFAGELAEPVGEFVMMGLELVQLANDLDLLGFESSLRVLSFTMKVLVEMTKLAADGLDVLIQPLRDLGLIRPQRGPGELRSSTGAAARQASFQSIESYQQQLQTAAYSQAAGQTSQRDVPNLVNRIAVSTEAIQAVVELLTMQGLTDAIRNALPTPPNPLPALANNVNQAVGTASSVVGNISAWINQNNPFGGS